MLRSSLRDIARNDAGFFLKDLMKREYYSDSIQNFLKAKPDEILGVLTKNSEFAVLEGQTMAWLTEIGILQEVLVGRQGSIYFEYSIPRMGKRIDALLLLGPAIFVLEFKIGSEEFASAALDQVWDYALDLKNFHETSHNPFIAPILIATESIPSDFSVAATAQDDKILFPIKCNTSTLRKAIESVLSFVDVEKGEKIDAVKWEAGRYSPTPVFS